MIVHVADNKSKAGSPENIMFALELKGISELIEYVEEPTQG
ncbi:hypothetical protein [Paenibacillus graminis]|nr:hypothetical protein [Paenibacillus graminis]MEC0167937.1 hypothetical protein [Paenibacillus graminis]